MHERVEFLKAYVRTRLRHFESREQLLAWQDAQVRAFLQQIVPQSPFYSRHFAGWSLKDWQTLPTVDKAAMMANFDDFNTAGLRKADVSDAAFRAEASRDFSQTVRGYTVGLSSGTSGNRGLFVVSPRERQQWAGVIIAKLLPNALFQRQRVALFLRANSNVYTTVQSSRIQFAYFDLMLSPPLHLTRLNDFQPTILVAPPSMLRYLAQAQTSGLIALRPQKIVSGAEVLDPLDQRYIEAAFGQKLHQVYQATEGFLGSTCEDGVLHLHEDIAAFQQDTLDAAAGKFAPIITDFNRTTQPIIRYRLDDVLTEKRGGCACGSPALALEHIEGRCDDVFYVPARTQPGWVMLFPDFIRRAVMSASADIRAYRAEQSAPDQIVFRLDVPPALESAAQRALSDEIRRLVEGRGGHVPRLTFEPLPAELPTDKKLRRVVRSFAIDPQIELVV